MGTGKQKNGLNKRNDALFMSDKKSKLLVLNLAYHAHVLRASCLKRSFEGICVGGILN